MAFQVPTNGRNQNGPNTKEKVVVPKSNALDPRNGVLVQPFKRLVEEGFITELTVVFTPNGYTASAKPDKRVADVDSSGLTEGVNAPLGVITAAADKGNLIPKKQGKAKNAKKADQPLPQRTLVKKDFEGTTDAQLLARMRVVAAESNGGTLIGRVRSAGRYNFETTLSYQEWWNRANVDDRALSLCQHKELAKLTEPEKNRLRGAPCPFRGTAEFRVATEASTTGGDDQDA